jgi:hypothetical protein
MELAALDLAGRVVGAARHRSRRPVLGHPAGARLEQVRVGAHVHDRREARVSGRAVVALEEVLGRDLPVAVELRLRALEEPECLEIDAGIGDALRDPVEELLERFRVRVRVDEEQRPPALEPELDEAELGCLDAALPVRAGSRDEPTVQSVRPGVIRALQRLAPPRALAYERAAVAAYVEEGAKLVFAIAHDYDGHVADRRREEGGGLGDVPGVPHVLPGATEDPLALELQNGRIRVPAPRQGLDVDRAHRAETLAAASTACGPAVRAGPHALFEPATGR